MTPGSLKVAILTCSDRCHAGMTVDTSGPALARMVCRRLGAQVIACACVPDEIDAIRAQVERWTSPPEAPDLILTTGGTGLAPRDVTPEAIAPLLERRLPALLELARYRCYAKTPRACLSRGEAGTVGRTLVVSLPGSERGATEMLEAIVDILPHAILTLRGEPTVHEHDQRPGADAGRDAERASP